MGDKASQSVSVGERKDTINNPLVSIIVPVLNGIKYLEPCIQSVLNQSYPHIEHIFADGGSTDGTLDMLSSYQAKYPDRIRFISEPDEGVGEALNKGLRTARGEVLGWLGSDDTYQLDAIQTVVEFFTANPDAYFVFGDCTLINETGEITGKYPTRDFNLEEVINKSCMVPTSASFYRREVFEKVGSYDILGNDLDYLIRVGKVFPIHHVEKVLSNFRCHQESQTSATGNHQMWLPGLRRSQKMWLREDYIVGRRHGGSIFSPRSQRYYRYIIFDWLRPILGFAYPIMRRVLGK